MISICLNSLCIYFFRDPKSTLDDWLKKKPDKKKRDPKDDDPAKGFDKKPKLE
jgi:hypothetical protein